MRIEWDDVKNARNKAKHGIGFEEVELFDWETALILLDDRQDYGEERRIAVGILKKRTVVFVYTKRGSIVRAISLRKANKREVRFYEKAGADQ